MTALLFALVLAAAGLFFLSSEQAYAASAPEASGRVTESDGVNIRSSYSTSSEIVAAMPYNAAFTVTEEKYTDSSSDADKIWYKITSSYGSGYVRSDLVTVTYKYADGRTDAILNTRTGPGSSFISAGLIQSGVSVKIALKAVNAAGEVWYKAYINNRYYYLSSAYVTITGSSAEDPSGPSESDPLTDQEFETMLTQQGFPESYKTLLRSLHEKYPTWRFKAKHLGYTWEEALEEQTASQNANTISTSFPEAYRAVEKGTYNFDTHSYIPKDGSVWFSASKEAVAYYMDPRNWLQEDTVFMFEPYTYNSAYQSETLVKKILSATALPEEASAYYMEAARQNYNGASYSISPIYLAAKTRIELGSGSFNIDGHEFTYGGKKYKGFYNTYNIGAVDSADGSAATRGLVFAAGGSDGSGTSYLRPWNSLEKAVKGGAIYIADSFINNNQYTLYYERYNVLNGLSAVGTHQYATSIFNAATLSTIMQADYKDFGVMEENFEFEVPVYEDMPASPAAMPPSKGNNNSYLDSITVKAGDKKLALTASFDRFKNSYTVKEKVGKSVSEITVDTKSNVSDAAVTVSGTTLKEGENKITIKVKSSSGQSTRYYYVYVTKDSSIDEEPSDGSENLIKGVEATTLKASSELGEGYIRVKWEKSYGYKMDYFEIYRSTVNGVYSDTPYFTTANGKWVSYKNNKDLTNGTRYYYKIRGVREIDGKKYCTQWSNQANRIYKTDEPEPEPDPNEKLIKGVEETTLKASSELGDGYIRVKWEKSYGYKMDYFEIYRSTVNGVYSDTPYFTTANGKWVSYKNNKDLTNGTRYYYKIRGVREIDGKKYCTQWSNQANRIYKTDEPEPEPDPNEKLIKGVEATTLKASSELGDGYIRVKWEKSYGYKMDAFEIYRSVKSGVYEEKPLYTTPNGKWVSYKNTTNLKKGSRYYYKVRGVREIDGQKYCTQWSNQANRIMK